MTGMEDRRLMVSWGQKRIRAVEGCPLSSTEVLIADRALRPRLEAGLSASKRQPYSSLIQQRSVTRAGCARSHIARVMLRSDDMARRTTLASRNAEGAPARTTHSFPTPREQPTTATARGCRNIGAVWPV